MSRVSRSSHSLLKGTVGICQIVATFSNGRSMTKPTRTLLQTIGRSDAYAPFGRWTRYCLLMKLIFAKTYKA
jgi:hypothetical protein